MNIKINYLAFLMLNILLVHLISCRKEENIQAKLDKLKGQGYFPMQVGNYWKFSDISVIKIDAIEEIDGKEFYRFIWEMDTTFYRETSDGKIVYLSNSKEEKLLYDLSGEVGDRWTIEKSSKDSTYMELSSKNDTIDINKYVFHNCYKYFSDGYDSLIIDNESSSWLAPNIGKIQIAGGTGIKKLEEVQIDGIKINFFE
jgi:hypothetical protein